MAKQKSFPYSADENARVLNLTADRKIINTSESFFLVDGKWVDVTDPSLVETFGVAEYTTVIGDPFMPVLFK